MDQPLPGPLPDDPDEHPYAASRGALIVAFLAVVVAGLSGAAIGYGLVGIGCRGDCGTVSGLGALVGGLVAAGGVAIVAVLLLRSMAEWKAGGIRRSQPAKVRRRKPSA